MIKFNYILNDIAFDTLVIKCLYGEPTNEDVEECENQIKLLQKENEHLKLVLNQIQYCPYDDKCGELYDCSKEEYETMTQSNMKLSLENQQLKHILDELEKYLEEERLRNTPKVRWKHYNEDGFHDYDVENGDYIEMQPVNITLTEVINKLKELRGRE